LSLTLDFILIENAILSIAMPWNLEKAEGFEDNIASIFVIEEQIKQEINRNIRQN
jgi:hypothetical protein